MINIPTFQEKSADFTQEIELGGQLVRLHIMYNIRIGFFFLNFTDQEGSILYGIKMVPEWLLLDWHRGTLNFSGDLVIRKTDDEAGDLITYDNFGNGWDLTYVTEAEVEAWEAVVGF